MDIQADNGNSIVAEGRFTFYHCSKFGHCGKNITLSPDQTSVERSQGVTGGVCTGSVPLQRTSEGGYEFTIRVDRTSPTGMRSLAVGFCQRCPKLDSSGRIFHDDGADLHDSVLTGYDKQKAAAIILDGKQQEVAMTWRPLQEIREQQQLHVQWTRHGSFVVSVDGDIKVEHSLSPPPGQVYPLVDIQGRVSAVSFVAMEK